MAIGASYKDDTVGLMSEALETAQQLIKARALLRRWVDMKLLPETSMLMLESRAALPKSKP